MNREEALGLLNAKLDGYRKLSYAELAARIGDEEFPEVVGPSSTEYQMEIQTFLISCTASFRRFVASTVPFHP